MGRITWDALGERLFEVGLDHGVLYFPFQDGYAGGIPWNGLTSVTEGQNGRSATALYEGDIKSKNVYTADEFGGSIKAYTYPQQFERFFGEDEVIPGVVLTHQDREQFGFSYRTLKGNDTNGTNFGYKIHLVYNAEIVEFSRSYSSVNESMDIEPLEWKYECFPMEYQDYGQIAEIVFDSTTCGPDMMSRLERIIYGHDDETPRLPTLEEIFSLFPQQLYPSDNIFPNGLEYRGNQWMLPLTITKNGTYVPETVDANGFYRVIARIRPDFVITDELPPVGEDEAFYYVYNESEGEGVFDEYMFLGGEWQKTGQKELPISTYSNYVRYELTVADIEEIINS